VSLTGWQAGIETDGVHGNAKIRNIAAGRILRELEAGKIVVVAGFQGVDPDGDITTLGRGGSDTTAVALAAWLKADRCRIFSRQERLPAQVMRRIQSSSGLSVRKRRMICAWSRN
jgi:aspartate kinase